MVTALVNLLPVAASVCRVVPWVTCQREMDQILAPGRRSYSKAGFLNDFPDALFKELLGCAASMPHPACQFEILRLGGAVSRIGPDDTAFAHRQARWRLNVTGFWNDAADDDVAKAWARGIHQVVHPSLIGDSYVSHAGEDEAGASAIYGRSMERLLEIKQKFDPENVFRSNFKVSQPPAVD